MNRLANQDSGNTREDFRLTNGFLDPATRNKQTPERTRHLEPDSDHSLEAVIKTGALCCVLLPKKAIERYPRAFADCLTRICTEFGGFTFDREVSGAWLERATEIVHEDHAVVVLIALSSHPSCIGILKAVIADAARDLGELSLFVSIGDRATIFVWASEVLI
jgi:hypothetical protein